MDQTKMKLINLKSGDVLSNQQLFQLFKCGNSGGLRYSSKYNLLDGLMILSIILVKES